MAEGNSVRIVKDIKVINGWRDDTYTVIAANSNGEHTYQATSVATAIPAGYKLFGVSFHGMPDPMMLGRSCYVNDDGSIYTAGRNLDSTVHRWNPGMCLWCVKY